MAIVIAKDLDKDAIGKIVEGRPGEDSEFNYAIFTIVGHARCADYVRLFVDVPVGLECRTHFDIPDDTPLNLVGNKVYQIQGP